MHTNEPPYQVVPYYLWVFWSLSSATKLQTPYIQFDIDKVVNNATLIDYLGNSSFDVLVLHQLWHHGSI